MSKIDELIQRLCPEGVEYRELGEIASLKRGTSITKNTANEGDYPVVAGGQRPAYYIDKFNREGETITVAGSGAYAGFVAFWREPIFVSDAFSVKANKDMSPRYIYHFLLNIQDKIHDLKKGGGVPHVYAKDVAKFKIPIPPLEIQREIVDILDKFTQLEAELAAELAARKRQYEYYRNQLLSFDDAGGVQWKNLGEVGMLVRGNGLQKKDFTESGFPAVHYGQIYTHYGTFANKTKSFVSMELAKRLKRAQKGDVLIAGTSENIEDVCKPCGWLGDNEIAISGDMFVFKPNTEISGKFLTYILQTARFFEHKKKYANGTKVVRVSADNIKKFEVPIPSLAEQNRITDTLDKFDALVNDISIGLPAEIAARRKQYEYYRSKLLTFPEKEATHA